MGVDARRSVADPRSGLLTSFLIFVKAHAAWSLACACREMLSYTKSAVTRNAGEKKINSLLDFVSASTDTKLLQVWDGQLLLLLTSDLMTWSASTKPGCLLLLACRTACSPCYQRHSWQCPSAGKAVTIGSQCTRRTSMAPRWRRWWKPRTSGCGSRRS